MILDAGPLVAYFCENEQHHSWSVQQFDYLKPPALTCEAVITEAAHLIQKRGADPALLRCFIKDKVIAKQKS